MKSGLYASAAVFLVAGVLVPYSVSQAQEGGAVALPEIVVSATPLPSSIGLDINKVPAQVSIVPSKDFEERKSPTVTDAITSHVPGAIAIDTDGSGISPDLYYRGFDVSRVSGTSNGLAVYQNGVRINEAFGDGVNLELVPPIAIDHADVYTNNPIFGLNALGGAVSFTMKNGFTFHGGDATILGGSYGRVQGTFEYGKQVDNYSFYVAADGFRDGGFRPFSSSNIERAYADLGYRSQDSEVHVIGGFGRSMFGALSSTPQVMVNQQYNSVFTNPQTTNNQAGLAQLTGRFDVAPHWTIASNFYIRQFDQYHVDGNDASIQECGNTGTACLSRDSAPPGTSARDRQFLVNGNTIPYLGNNFPYGTTLMSGTHSRSVGTQQQATNKDQLFGHDNYFVIGASVDHSDTNFSSQTYLGELNGDLTNVLSGFPGAGSSLATRGAIGYGPVWISSNATYVGVFALDTFNITKQLAVTAGARFNYANINVQDLTSSTSDLNSSANYNRVNPVVGLTYEISPAITLYGGYSEANRAPTPLETSCANPARPCVLETALVSDPPLQQVVSRTIEAGARGVYEMPNSYGTLTYKAGYFRTKNSSDIISLPSVISGQGYYANVPGTLRQGAEVGVQYAKGPWTFYGNYAYVDATYQFTGQLASPNNPFADANGNVTVNPGNHIPGIPRNLGKIGFDYDVTERFKVGMDAVLVGSQYYIGDNANQNPQLPFYYTLNMRASYQVTDHVQVFVLANNVTNNRYATYGAYYDTGTTAALANRTLAANAAAASPNASTITVAQPLSVYGGVKVTF